jgi:hypothetical protein
VPIPGIETPELEEDVIDTITNPTSDSKRPAKNPEKVFPKTPESVSRGTAIQYCKPEIKAKAEPPKETPADAVIFETKQSKKKKKLIEKKNKKKIIKETNKCDGGISTKEGDKVRL